MIEPSEISRMERAYQDAAQGYGTVPHYVYAKDVLALIAERKELLDYIRELEEQIAPGPITLPDMKGGD